MHRIGALKFAAVFMASFIIFNMLWVRYMFGITSIPLILSYIPPPHDALAMAYVPGYLLRCLLPSLALPFLLMFLRCRRYGWLTYPAFYVSFAAFMFAAICMMWLDPMNHAMFADSSTFYEDRYINADDVEISFGEKKSLIFISLESMNLGYFDSGIFGRNLIRRLSELSVIGEKGRYYAIDGLSTTILSQFAALCGTPLICPVRYDDFSKTFGPFWRDMIDRTENIRCIPDILAEEGYGGMFIAAIPDGMEKFFAKHGNFPTFMSCEGCGSFMDDGELYDFALRRISGLKVLGRPYMAVISTISMHGPDGFMPKKCGGNMDYAAIVECVDMLTEEFVRGISVVDPDAVIVVAADHFAWKVSISGWDKVYHHGLYNVFLNSGRRISPERRFTALDIMPTMIEAIGGEIKGRRLGLGVSLFDDGRRTLLEEYPREKLSYEMLRPSKMYYRLLNRDSF